MECYPKIIENTPAFMAMTRHRERRLKLLRGALIPLLNLLTLLRWAVQKKTSCPSCRGQESNRRARASLIQWSLNGRTE
jgi:hypothetical protein